MCSGSMYSLVEAGLLACRPGSNWDTFGSRLSVDPQTLPLYRCDRLGVANAMPLPLVRSEAEYLWLWCTAIEAMLLLSCDGHAGVGESFKADAATDTGTLI